MSAWPSPIRSAATFLVTAILLSVVAVEGPPRCVLLVYQDDGINPTSVVFEQSLAQPLRAQLGANLDFYREHLEWGRFPNDRERAIEHLRSRFADRHIEIVIFVGNVPSVILPSVPSVYVRNHSSEMLQAKVNQIPTSAF